jgi:hypothetical protein
VEALETIGEMHWRCTGVHWETVRYADDILGVYTRTDKDGTRCAARQRRLGLHGISPELILGTLERCEAVPPIHSATTVVSWVHTVRNPILYVLCSRWTSA